MSTGRISLVAADAAGAARVVVSHPGQLNAPRLAEGGPGAAQRHGHFGCADSAEHREGLAAFREKRDPRL